MLVNLNRLYIILELKLQLHLLDKNRVLLSMFTGCHPVCRNNGTANTATCSCSCAPEWRGSDCSGMHDVFVIEPLCSASFVAHIRIILVNQQQQQQKRI